MGVCVVVDVAGPVRSWEFLSSDGLTTYVDLSQPNVDRIASMMFLWGKTPTTRTILRVSVKWITGASALIHPYYGRTLRPGLKSEAILYWAWVSGWVRVCGDGLCVAHQHVYLPVHWYIHIHMCVGKCICYKVTRDQFRGSLCSRRLFLKIELWMECRGRRQ
jgi:hypothetical protein